VHFIIEVIEEQSIATNHVPSTRE